MSNKKTILSLEEPSPMASDGSPAVLAYRVGQLEKGQSTGFARLEQKLDDISNVYATQAALIDAKREAELEHEKINEKIGEVHREASRANRVIARVGWFVIYAVLAAVLAIIGLNVYGGHHG